MPEDRRKGGYVFEASGLPIELEPDSSLLVYYVLISLLGGPLFPLILLPLYVRYVTLRYRLDEEGVRMRRGALFRREVSVAYRRIQDIHLSSNVIERWLGLGKVRIQTASGGAEAEITVEGLKDLDALRDFLYDRSRGSKSPPAARAEHVATSSGGGTRGEGDAADPLADVLRALLAEVRALRGDLAERDRT